MDRLAARGRAAAESAVARAVARVAERVGEAPGVTAEIEGDRVAISGRALWRRPELRWIGGMLR